MESLDCSFDWKGFGSSLLLVCAAFAAVLVVSSPLSAAAPAQAQDLSVPMPEMGSLSASTTLGILFSTSTRSIMPLTIAGAVPAHGKFIAADLVNMELTLYEDGSSTATYRILTKGKPGSPYETPAGIYEILTKEVDHFNHAEAVHMPYSMEFYGNYFIHGWPTYADGTPVASTYSGGCIRLSTADAEKVYSFASRGMEVFVYDPGSATTTPSIALDPLPLPDVSAASYLVADIDSGDVYAEHDAGAIRPIASITKLMTALVANETIMFDQKISVARGALQDIAVASDTARETFTVGNLLYPLLMESNNNIADILGERYGTGSFVAWMNAQAKALDMASTTFADPSGVSRDNASTPEDLYRLSVYLADKKSFVWNITRTPEKTIVADDGSRYSFSNYNLFSNQSSFIGGKVGHTEAAQDTMVSLFAFPLDGQLRRVAIIVLGSQGYATDTERLAEWFDTAANSAGQTACASCSIAPHYRKIQL